MQSLQSNIPIAFQFLPPTPNLVDIRAALPDIVNAALGNSNDESDDEVQLQHTRNASVKKVLQNDLASIPSRIDFLRRGYLSIEKSNLHTF